MLVLIQSTRKRRGKHWVQEGKLKNCYYRCQPLSMDKLRHEYRYWMKINIYHFNDTSSLLIMVFCNRQTLKSTWFNTFMSGSIARFKRSDNQSRNLNWKIISVREWKCSGNRIPKQKNYEEELVLRKTAITDVNLFPWINSDMSIGIEWK
jgi:hypothetical protein